MSPSDRPYHHGDLRAALIDAGLALTRSDGPEALRLREATRDVGVSPNAAYRHFADRRELLDAVGRRIQERMAERMLAHRSAAEGSRAARARDGLRAVGLGYIDFATSEPGWFAVAFFPPPTPAQDVTPHEAAPFRLLVEALDELAAAGVLPQDAREGAEWACWSTVHGFADLATRGPLAAQPPAEVRRHAERVIESIIDGICLAS